MIADAVMVLVAGGLAWLLTSGQPPFTWLQSLTLALLIMIFFSWTMQWARFYRVENYSSVRRGVFDLFCGFLIATLVGSVVLVAFVPDVWNHRDWLLTWIGAIFGALVFERIIARVLVRLILSRSMLQRRVAIVGSGPLVEVVAARLRQPKYARDHHLIGIFDPHLNRSWRAEGDAAANQAQQPDLTRYAQNYSVDLVVIALPWSRSEEIFALMRELQWIAADVVIPFDAPGFRPQFVPSIGVADSPVLQVMHRPFKGTQGILKLIEDYSVAALGLLLVSPIMLAAAIAIRLDDGAPVMFLQPRMGLNGKTFMIYKFRTMTVDLSDDGSLGTKRDNQRITRVGGFLRKTSIDELPQLFNVLRGEMSIVGPRPHVANMRVEGEVYSELVRQYAARHRIKPGITGWAQINGMRGGIDTVDKANLGADLDLFYIANWSLRLDIKIMIRTVFRDLVGRNVF
jgi:putative colanic acid biosynthesis UDP-glucose lipid carrier transferase